MSSLFAHGNARLGDFLGIPLDLERNENGHTPVSPMRPSDLGQLGHLLAGPFPPATAE